MRINKTFDSVVAVYCGAAIQATGSSAFSTFRSRCNKTNWMYSWHISSDRALKYTVLHCVRSRPYLPGITDAKPVCFRFSKYQQHVQGAVAGHDRREEKTRKP